MSSIFKAFKNLGKVTQKANVEAAVQKSTEKVATTTNHNSKDMAAHVLLNNASKMPRIGCKYPEIGPVLQVTVHSY